MDANPSPVGIYHQMPHPHPHEDACIYTLDAGIPWQMPVLPSNSSSPNLTQGLTECLTEP